MDNFVKFIGKNDVHWRPDLPGNQESVKQFDELLQLGWLGKGIRIGVLRSKCNHFCTNFRHI